MSGSVFSRFATPLQEAIGGRLGWSRLYPVQELAGAAILDGKNAIVLAPTAGGKTEASMFPTLSLLLQHAAEGVGALYLAPLKALLNDQAERLGLYTEMVGLRRFLWHGDVTAHDRRAFVADPAELLMTTPESLEVMLASSAVPVKRLFADLRIVVVDEVHSMAGTDRGAHLLSVIERIADASRHDVQRVGLSATVGNPPEILGWLSGTSSREGVVIDPPRAPRPRDLSITLEADPDLLAGRAAGVTAGKKSLLFCESRALTEQLADCMRDRGTDVFVHHSSVSLTERRRAEESFHAGGSAAIVCTSTLELGIDIGDLDLVLQANAPATVSSFLQRMGRTGRRGDRPSTMKFFCEDVAAVAQAVALIELARSGWVESIAPQTRCWPLLVHQLLAFTLEAAGVTRAECWRRLSRLPDLAAVSREEHDAVIDHMVATAYLFEAGGQLSMGEATERSFGKKNFIELYAVFSSPQLYRVISVSGAEVGSLDQSFVDRLEERMTSFLLGGRAWLVEAIDDKQRILRVSPAPRGKKPAWGGFAPRLLSFALCQQIKRVLSEEPPRGYLSEPAALALAQYREELTDVLGPQGRALQGDQISWRWWTFAGGAINQTLKHAVSVLTGWRVSADNLRLRFEGEQLTEGAVRQVISQLSSPALWDDVPFWTRVLTELPPYRLSKFQPVLPQRYQLEMMGNAWLDLPGTRSYVQSSPPALGAEALSLRSLALAAIPTMTTATTAESLPLARPQLPLRRIDDMVQLRALCAELMTCPLLALDVETTMAERELCLIQLGVPEYNAILDVRRLDDLGPLAPVLESSSTIKIIHDAAFEREVLGKLNLSLCNVVDTLTLSRRLRGRLSDGHSLAAVCRRELGLQLDKTARLSDWTARPLTQAQLDYAALDVEILLEVHAALTSAPSGPIDPRRDAMNEGY